MRLHGQDHGSYGNDQERAGVGPSFLCLSQERTLQEDLAKWNSVLIEERF